jgi:hypothetical protein
MFGARPAIGSLAKPLLEPAEHPQQVHLAVGGVFVADSQPPDPGIDLGEIGEPDEGGGRAVTLYA